MLTWFTVFGGKDVVFAITCTRYWLHDTSDVFLCAECTTSLARCDRADRKLTMW
jgi:hypothetical protein